MTPLLSDWGGADEQSRAFPEERQHALCPLQPYDPTPCACLDPSVLPPGCQNACSAIHHHFGLSYANYLVVRRSVLQSMPREWQAKFVALLKELDAATVDLEDPVAEYKVIPRGEDGKRVVDPYAHYDRGRRVVRLKPKES